MDNNKNANKIYFLIIITKKKERIYDNVLTKRIEPMNHTNGGPTFKKWFTPTTLQGATGTSRWWPSCPLSLQMTFLPSLDTAYKHQRMPSRHLTWPFTHKIIYCNYNKNFIKEGLHLKWEV